MSDDVTLPREIAQNALLAILEEFSEEAWCAGWMSGLEFGVWAILEGDSPNNYGQGSLSAEDQENMQVLATTLDAWPVWSDPNKDIAWLPLSEWRKRYAAHLTPSIKADYAQRWERYTKEHKDV